MRWRNAARPPSRARHSALAAERDAREAAQGHRRRRRRARAARGAAQRTLANVWRTSNPSLKPRARRRFRRNARLPPSRIRQRSNMMWKPRAPMRQRRRLPSPTRGAEAATRARESAADRERMAPPGASSRSGASAARMRRYGSPGADRQKQQAEERSELEREPAELDSKIRELEQSNDESQARIGEAAAAERAAEEAVVGARRPSLRSTSNRPRPVNAEPPPAPAPRRSRREAPNSLGPASRSSNACPSGCRRSSASIPTNRAMPNRKPQPSSG